MAVARHGSGRVADVRAFASQVHPVFMLPPVATAVFGGVLARSVSWSAVVLVSLGTFFAVYTAHVKDGYVDYHVRGEDDDHPLTERGCKVGLVGAGVGFAGALVGLSVTVGPSAAVVLVPAWVIGYLHAPTLDTNPIGATMGYPTGIAVVMIASNYAQGRTVRPIALGFALVFLLLLTGVKIVDDLTDVGYDASIDKHTVGVVLGPSRASELAYLLMGASFVLVLMLTIDGVFPPSTPLAIPAFALVALYARAASAGVATKLLVRGAYLFLAGIVVAAYFEPLAGTPLPDVTALGRWTYLATEVLFGAVALALLASGGDGAFRRAGKTIAVLYPVAYLWDWYTLEVGVFAIPMRTGIELVGIPLEEHLFMLVVPAFVLGIHEVLHASEDD